MKKNKILVKITASVLLFTFSYSQILYAADVRQMLLDAKAFFMEEDARRPHGMAVSDLQAAQNLQQAAVDQQQLLQDFQNTKFNLTTPNGDILKYVGDKLSEVERPDGTKLSKIVTDVAGNIQNADLRLSDGSIQVLQGGKVLGYQTPDGSQVLYDAMGAVWKVISKGGVESIYTYTKDAMGIVTETVVDNAAYQAKYDANQKIKEATRKSDNQKIYYASGIIQRIVNADASQVLFNSAVVNGDTVVTPQGGGSDVYIDARGNRFNFTSGSVSSITLTDNSTVDNIIWDAANKIDGATLTEADGSRHIYQLKKLTRSYDVAGIVTNYTYNATNIQAVKAGETWEYLLDKAPVKFTSLLGMVTTYIQSGTYKGHRETEVLATGQKFVYEYAGSGNSITVQKREAQSSVHNITTFDGQTVNAQGSNPGFKTTVQFPNDGSIDPSVVITAINGSKNLKLTLLSGSGSTYTWAGVTTSLGITLNKATDYKVEVKWETGRIGLYVYAAASPKPPTPTMSVADRAWDPKFKAVSTNVVMTFDSTSSGFYNRNFQTKDKNNSKLPISPILVVEFNRIATSYKTLTLKATQAASGNITRTLSYWLDPNDVWNYTTSDYNSSTGATTNTSGTLAQTIPTGVDYIGELRIENGKSNLYMYQKGISRPAAPTISLAAFNVSTALEASSANALGQGALYKNLSTPAYSTALMAGVLTSRVDTVQNSLIIKPAAPSSVNVTDFNSITYDSTAALKQVLFKDGSKLIFNQGVLTQAFDTAGILTSFNFEQSGLANIVGASIVQSNLTSTYSAEGKLASILVNDLTMHYKADGTTVEWIEKSDGTELWNLIFDAAGALTGASIYAPSGEIRTYAAGKLINLRQPDQSQLFYVDSKVTQMITPDKLTYNFDYTNPSIIQATLAGVPPVDTLTPIKMEYDTNFNLKKVIRQNQEILNYLNTDLIKIDVPQNASKVFNYTKDAQGKVLSYTVTQGNILTYYDANNQPLRAVISADATNPNNLDISYQYGKIRQVKKNNVLTFIYSYSFEASGEELTVVEDLEENTQKTYRDSNLASTLDKATNVLSSYEYVNSKVSKVTVTRFGRLLHTYGYSYSGTNTVVQDEAGVVRTYDTTKKLTLLEKNGEKYSYTYSTQTITTPGSPVVTETLLPNSLYQTSARSLLSWNNGPAWFSYEQAYGKDYLQTHWAGQWVEYTVNMSQAGDLKLALEATDSNALPAGYATFQLELSVDGAAKGAMDVPAVGNNAWQSGLATLTGLSQGSHVIRVKFNNFLNSGGQQTDFKFRNISFKQVVTTPTTTTTQQEIVQETLVEKKMADGALIHYSNGRVNQIDQADGKVLKNFVLDANGNVSGVTLFANAQSTTGTEVSFTEGRISKVTLLTGQALLFTYDKDAGGNVVTTWVQKGVAKLKYNMQDSLLGVKIAGVMDPAALMAGLTNVYTGGNGGFLSFDGDPATAQTAAFGGGTGNEASNLLAEHGLPAANTITGFSYRLDTSAYSSGSTNNGSSAYILLETKDATTGLWTTVPGTAASQSHSNGGGGGSTAMARTVGTGLVTVTLNIPNVIAVRARVGASAYSNGGGNYGGAAYIYETQFSLADESFLTMSPTGYTLSGVKGTLVFDAAGAVTQSSAALASIQQELTGVIQNYKANPYKNVDFLGMWGAIYDSETLVAQEYSTNGTLETQTKVDGTTTLFENNKPSKVLDRGGRVLIQYTYDAQGNPTRVYLKNARDTLPDEVVKAKLDIQTQRAASLRTLAAQKNLAYQSIQAQFQNARIVLDAQIASQQGLYDNISSVEAKGKDAKTAKADALGQIGDNINLLETNLTSLYDQEADAYAALDAQVMTLSNQIEANSQTAFTQLSAQEANLKKEILRQEVSPIVYDYYRRILGRDPDSTEYSYWINLIDYNSGATLTEVKTTANTNLTAALSTYINAQPELTQRQTYVSAIKTAVTSQINSYLSMTQAQKEAFAATLGLTAQDLVPISSADTAKILNWINTRSLHFGQSAFIALETLLDQKGKVYTRETLARQCILIDVLTGVISPLDDGDLVISVFALNKVAGLYGVTLTGANLSWDDLKAIVPTTSTATSPRVIAHINGNHYVIITAMTANSITYIDPGIGKDKQNESLTVSKAGFLKVWHGSTSSPQGGNVTLSQTDFNSIKTIRGAATQAKVLSAMEAKNVRGAFWGSILGLIGSILTWIPGLNAIGLILTGISAAVSAIEGDWISAISSLVTLGLGNFGTALKGAFDGFVKAMGPLGQVFQAAGNIIGGIYKAVTGLVGSISNALGGFLQGVGISSVAATKIAQFAVSKGLTIAATKGFEIIGINPQIAGFLGSLTSGAVMASISPQTRNESGQLVSRADMIRTSIQQSVTIAQIGNLGVQMGLDPIFTRILSNSLATIQGIAIQNPMTALDQSFSLVKNQLTSSLAQYSLEKLGNSLGLNSFISTAIAAPIAANLASSLSTTKWTGQVASTANDGIAVSRTKVNKDGYEVSVAGLSTTEQSWWNNVFNFLQNNVYLAAASAASAYYLTKPSIVGAGQALPPPTSTEMPIPANATAVNYTDYFTGASKAGYQINSSPTNYIVYDRATGNPVKRVSNGVVEEGVFEGIVVLKADGSVYVDYKVNPDYISKGQIKYTTDDGGQARFKVVDGKIPEIYIDAASPNIVLNPGTTKDATNKVLNGIVKILTLGLELSVTNGTVSKSTGGQQGSGELTKKLTTSYIFGNGFENGYRAENTPDPLMQSYADALRTVDKITNSAREFIVYLYEQTKMLGNAVDWFTDFKISDDDKNFLAMIVRGGQVLFDIMLNPSGLATVPAKFQGQFQYWAEWYKTNVLGLGNNLVQETINELETLQNSGKGPIKDGIAFAHSGFTAPLLAAIEQMQYDVKTVLIYEGPHPNYKTYFTNPSLERIIHVQGTGGPFDGDAWVPFLGKAEFGGVENINIEIEGAFHGDFSYNEAEWDAKIAAANGSTPAMVEAQKNILRAQKERNREVNVFMRQLYRFSLEDQSVPGRLEFFLQNTPGIEYDSLAKFARVDLELLTM